MEEVCTSAPRPRSCGAPSAVCRVARHAEAHGHPRHAEAYGHPRHAQGSEAAACRPVTSTAPSSTRRSDETTLTPSRRYFPRDTENDDNGAATPRKTTSAAVATSTRGLQQRHRHEGCNIDINTRAAAATSTRGLRQRQHRARMPSR